MRSAFISAVFALLTGCQEKIAIPTVRELVSNRQLLAEWQSRCETGEYSRLRAQQREDLCSTTGQATISRAQQAASKNDAAFFEANTKRK